MATDLIVNGKPERVETEADTPLLYILRNDLGVLGPKFGCGLGQCGACTVIVDKEPVFSCLTPVSAVAGRPVRTIEGLGTIDAPGPVQRAFVEEQAAQCGYCIAGMVMRAQALLERNPAPNAAEVRRFMSPNLCRCGTHMRILRAVDRAARVLQAGDSKTASAR